MKQDKTICDRCNHYRVNASGTTETCAIHMLQNAMLPTFTKDYRDERFNGNKNHCKGFQKL